MAITETIEINRPPQDVFAYLDDLARHREWQEQIVEVEVDTEGPVGVGTRAKPAPVTRSSWTSPATASPRALARSLAGMRASSYRRTCNG